MLPNISNPTSHQLPAQNVSQGIFVLIGSLLLYTIQDALIRVLPSTFTTFQIIFFRSLFSLLPLFVLGVFEKKQTHIKGPLLKTNYIGAQVLRGVIMFVSLCFYVMACKRLPMATLYTLSYTSPLFVTLLAIPFLGERIGLYRTCGIIMGFCGVIVAMQPGTEAFQSAGFLAILSGLFTGTSIVLGKRLALEDSNTLITLTYVLVSLFGSLIMLPSLWVEPSLFDFLILLLIGITGGIAQYGFIHAFRMAPASTLAPFDYSGLVWAILVGYFVWGEWPSSMAHIGSALVVCGGLITLYRSKSERLQKPAVT